MPKTKAVTGSARSARKSSTPNTLSLPPTLPTSGVATGGTPPSSVATLMPPVMPAAELAVGAIVAYECLLDATAGTATWRVGSILALPGAPAATAPQAAVTTKTKKPVAKAAACGASTRSSPAKTPSHSVSADPAPSEDDDDSVGKEDGSWHVAGGSAAPAAVCQTVLLQPWISLAPTATTRAKAHGVGPAGGARSPSPRQQLVSPTARLAEIVAMQKELERISLGEDGAATPTAPADSSADDEVKDARLAAVLSEAYSRVLVSPSRTRSDDTAGGAAADRAASAGRAVTEENGRAAIAGGDEDDEDDEDAELVDPVLRRQIGEKRAEFRERIEAILADMTETRARQRALAAAQRAATASLEEAKRQLREAQEKVQHIDVRQLREIQGYRLPPAVVKLVMDAVLCVLGEKAPSWPDVVACTRNPTFIPNVVSFDTAQLTPARVAVLKKDFISNPRFSYADALKGSQALGQFHEWVMRQLQLVDANGDHERFLVEKEESGKAAAAARRKMEADAEELRHLEAELDGLVGERTRQKHERRSGTRHADGTASLLSTMSSASPGHPSPAPEALAPPPSPPPPPPPSSSSADGGEAATNLLTTPAAAGDEVAKLTGLESPGSIDARLRAVAAQAAEAYAAEKAGSHSLPRGTSEVAASGRRASALAGAHDVASTSGTQLAQEQQLLSMLPPGAKWMCPQSAVPHGCYVLRSSILCVLGQQQPRAPVAAPPATVESAATLAAQEVDIFELTPAQRQYVTEALYGPARSHSPPLPPPTTSASGVVATPLPSQGAAAAAAASTSAPYSNGAPTRLVTTSHTKAFDGEEWNMVVEDSAAELRHAIVEDVAMLCRVPNRAVTDVAWALGSLHVQCAICHADSDSAASVQACLEAGAYPTVMALYERRHRTRDSLDEDAARELQQAARLASMEEEVQAAQQAEADARRETQALRDAFEKEKQALAEQVAVAQTASQVESLEDVREHLAFREAVQESATARQALQERTAHLARVEALLQAREEAAARDAEDYRVAAAAHREALAATEARAQAAQTALAEAEQRAERAEAEAHAVKKAAEAAKKVAQQRESAAQEKEAELHAAQSALEEARAKRQTAVQDAQGAAAAQESQQQAQIAALKQQLADAQQQAAVQQQHRQQLEKALEEVEREQQRSAAAAAAASAEAAAKESAALAAAAEAAVQGAARVAELERQAKDAAAAQAALENKLQAALTDAQNAKSTAEAEAREREKRAAEKAAADASAAAATEAKQQQRAEIDALKERNAQLQQECVQWRREREQAKVASTAAAPPGPPAAAKNTVVDRKRRQLGEAQARAAAADAALIEALQAQVNAAEAATEFCAGELEAQKAAESAAEARQSARRTAVAAIKSKVQDFASAKASAASQALPPPFAAEKDALTQQLIAQLDGVEKEKAAIKAAITHTQHTLASMQQQVEDTQARAANLEEARRTARVRLQALAASSAADGTAPTAAVAEDPASRVDPDAYQEALVDVSERVIAVMAALSAALDGLTEHQHKRAAAPVDEAAHIARLFHSCDGAGGSAWAVAEAPEAPSKPKSTKKNGSGGVGAGQPRSISDAAVQLMMQEVYEAATSSFLNRHQRTWMSVCLTALLLLAVTTLQYRKYRVA